jgi:surface antigen
MRIPHVLTAAALSAIVLTGCTANDFGRKEAAGTLLGGGLGALAGSQIGGGRGQLIATSVGTLLGAYLGNQAGRSLDRADQAYATEAEYQALEYTPSGSEVAWRNPDSGHYGYVTPHRTYETSSGSYCREYSHNASIDGYVERVHGTACRDETGAWRAVH